MSQLAPDARKLVAQSGANLWFPAVTEEEINNEQLLIDNYRRAMGGRRIAWGVLGFIACTWIYSYVKGE